MSIVVFATDAKSKSMLTVQSAGNEDIRVVLDGKRFEPNDNSLVIQDIATGRHSIKVYRQKNNGGYSIFGKRYEMVYNTSLQINNRTHLKISIDRMGRASVQETKLINNRGNDRGRNNDRDFDYDNDGQWGDYDRHEAYARAMSDREFRTVLQSIDKEWLESNKLKSSLQVVKNNSMSAAQVKELLLLFSFENNKLELAKQAYMNTIDKKNYGIVYSVFSFNSSKTELDRYIRTIR